jgi:hypothetical protein
MDTSVINKLPLQKERKFKVLLLPYGSLVFANHHNGKTSLGDGDLH